MSYRDLPLRYIRDPRLGHRLGRNYPADQFIDPVWKTPWLGTNANGFYGMFEDVPKRRTARGELRVLLLGGSAAMGLGATGRDHLISARIQQSLGTMGLDAIVINAAVGDYASCQEVSYLVGELVEYEFDVVVVLDGFNDFASGAFGTKFSSDWIPNTTRSYDDAVNAILTWDKSFSLPHRLALRYKYSSIGLWYQKMLKAFAGKDVQSAKRTHGLHFDRPEDWKIRPEIYDWYFNNLLTLMSVATGRGACFLGILQPALLYPTERIATSSEHLILERYAKLLPRIYELAPYHYKFLSARHRDFVGQESTYGPVLSHQSKVRLIDGMTWLDQYSETVYADPFHYNDLGQSHLGGRIAASIADLIGSNC